LAQVFERDNVCPAPARYPPVPYPSARPLDHHAPTSRTLLAHRPHYHRVRQQVSRVVSTGYREVTPPDHPHVVAPRGSLPL